MGKLCLIVLALHLFYGAANAENRFKRAALGTVCALSIAVSSSALTWQWTKPTVSATSSGSVAVAEGPQNYRNYDRYPLFDGNIASTFRIKDKNEKVPFVNVFQGQKKLLDMVREYAKSNNVPTTDIKPSGLEMRISKVEFVKQAEEGVLFSFHLESGPIQMHLQKMLTVEECEALAKGNWLMVTFPDYKKENEIVHSGFKLGTFKAEATLKAVIRYDASSGLLILSDVKSDITVTITTIGKPTIYKDSVVTTGLHGTQVEPSDLTVVSGNK